MKPPSSHQHTLSYPPMPIATPKIELIYDPDCPNVEQARERLSQAVAERGQASEPSTRRLPSP